MSGIKRWDWVNQMVRGDDGGRFVKYADHEAEVARLRAEVERLDDGESQAIKERDHAEKIIDKLCDAVIGTERAEWSSGYFFEDAVDDVETAIYRLRAEVETYRQDAERYRWLRNDAMTGTKHDPAVLKDGPTDCCDFMFGDELDEAIDAAMGASA